MASDASNTQAVAILSVASWFISILVFTPLEMYWFYLFWRQRKNLFISTRKPELLLCAEVRHCHLSNLTSHRLYLFSFLTETPFRKQIGIWLWTFFQFTLLALQSIFNFEYPAEGHFWTDGTLYAQFAFYLIIVGFVGISLTRWWLLFFMIKTSSALKGVMGLITVMMREITDTVGTCCGDVVMLSQ